MSPIEERKACVKLVLKLKNLGFSKDEMKEYLKGLRGDAIDGCKGRGELDHIIELIWTFKRENEGRKQKRI